MKEYTCPKCGYEAYKKAKLGKCPLCIICKGCDREVGRCSCLEGE